MKYNQRGVAETYYHGPSRLLEPSLPLLRPALRRKAKETWASDKSISFISFLSFLFAFTVYFVDPVNHFHAKIKLNIASVWKSPSDFGGSHILEEDGKLNTRLWLFPVAQPSHPSLITAPKNLLPRCWQMLIKMCPCQEWALFPMWGKWILSPWNFNLHNSNGNTHRAGHFSSNGRALIRLSSTCCL